MAGMKTCVVIRNGSLSASNSLPQGVNDSAGSNDYFEVAIWAHLVTPLLPSIVFYLIISLLPNSRSMYSIC